MKKAILIDGNSLMFRCYYGTINQLQFFEKNNIKPTNAIKTMMLTIFKLLKNNNYEYGVIAFDHKDPNFRKEEFADYKATRKKTPESLIEQIEPIKEIMQYFGLNVFCISGIEADDVVGSSMKLLNQNGIFCEIYSSDNDLLQLVNDKTNVIQFKKGITETITYTNENFCSLYNGLAPFQVIELKSISGDNSDNIPGIKGLGPKTAINLLNKFKTIENMYNNIDLIESASVKNKVLENKENVFKYKKLATILQDFFETKQIDIFKIKKINIEKIKEIVEFYKFSGFNKYLEE